MSGSTVVQLLALSAESEISPWLCESGSILGLGSILPAILKDKQNR